LAEVCTVPVLLVTTGLINLHIILNLTQQRITDAGRGATTFSKFGVQFLGLDYCTEQNTDGIRSLIRAQQSVT